MQTPSSYLDGVPLCDGRLQVAVSPIYATRNLYVGPL